MRGELARPDFRAALGFVLLVALSAFYFDSVFRLHTGVWLRMGLGDWVDPYFINALLEQWRYSVRHLTNPISPPMFFPERGTLGYSHSLVLYAPFYIVARLAFHPFQAYTVTILLVIEIGVLSLYMLLRRFLALGVFESLALVAAFATSENIINGSTGVWTQRASIFLVPPILFLGLLSAQRRRGTLRSLGLAAAGLLGATLFTHDIYTGLLSALVAVLLSIGLSLFLRVPSTGIRFSFPPTRHLSRYARVVLVVLVSIVVAGLVWAWVSGFGGIFGIVVVIRHHHWERPLYAALASLVAVELIRGGVRNRIAIVDPAAALDIGALGAGAALGLLGFFCVYYGAFRQHPGLPPAEVLASLIRRDTTGWTRLVWEPASFLPYLSGRSLAMLCAIALVCCAPWLRIPMRLRLYALWLAAMGVIVVAIPIRIGDIALWKYASTVPGFSAIRDPTRVIYPFELAVALGLGLLLAQLPRSSLLRHAIPVFVGIVIVAKWNPEKFDYERPIVAFEQWVDAPVAVDGSCRSFFIKGASAAYMSRSPHMWGLYANDAAFLATKYAVPTLNGYSAWEPPEWHLANPQESTYPRAVGQWIAIKHLDDVCELDIDRRTMTPYN